MATFKSIPASMIVNVQPAVLSAGGNALSFNGMFLSYSELIPDNEVVSYSNPDDVAAVFGTNSIEYKAAAAYFNGYENSSRKPGLIHFYKYNPQEIGARVYSAQVSPYSLDNAKRSKTDLIASISGVEKKLTADKIAAISTFTDLASAISTAFDVNAAYNETTSQLVISTKASGPSQVISFTENAASGYLGLTLGSTINVPGRAAISIYDILNNIKASNQNWVSLVPLVNLSNPVKLIAANWANDSNKRFLTILWDENDDALTGSNSSLGAQIKNINLNGVALIYAKRNEGYKKAAFLAGAIASVDWSERNGRINYAFRRQDGLAADVTNQSEANRLIENGYNFYGAWATAADRFLSFYPGQVSGSFKWIDNYINQIRINSQFQLMLVEMLMNVKSIPYNSEGKAYIRAAMKDVIDEALNFGSIRSGVKLSNLQAAQINADTGIDAASQIYANGFYVHIGDATPQIRQSRQSMPIKFWYTDGGSLIAINVTSTNVL